VTQAASLLNTSRDTVLRLIQDGSLVAYQLRPLSPYKVRLESVLAYRDKVRSRHGLDIQKR